MIDIAYTGDTISRIVTLTFRAGSGITTIVGGAVVCAALKLDGTGTTVAGTATILTATTAKVSFATSALSPGTWEFQMRGTPIGGDPTTVAEVVTLKLSAM